MNHPTLPYRSPATKALHRLRAAWRTLTGPALNPQPSTLNPQHPYQPLTYVCAALHLQPGSDSTTLSLGTLTTDAPPHAIEAAFLGHLVNHSPGLKAQQLLHVCSVPAGQVNPYPIQP